MGKAVVTMVANAVIIAVYVVCVTYAATFFDNSKLLWWYVLVTCIGFTYTHRQEKNDEQ